MSQLSNKDSQIHIQDPYLNVTKRRRPKKSPLNMSKDSDGKQKEIKTTHQQQMKIHGAELKKNNPKRVESVASQGRSKQKKLIQQKTFCQIILQTQYRLGLMMVISILKKRFSL